MASLQDITERRRAEREQRASEERYKTLFESSRDAIYITTPDGTYVDANQAAADLFGYTREELQKVNARQLYADPADAVRFQKAIEETGFVRDFSVRLRKKDKTEMDCLITVTAWRADDGSILEYQGIVRDITERKHAEKILRNKLDKLERRAHRRKKTFIKTHKTLREDIAERKGMEEQLQQSEERFRKLVETMRVGLSAMDQSCVITYVNDHLCNMLGLLDG